MTVGFYLYIFPYFKTKLQLNKHKTITVIKGTWAVSGPLGLWGPGGLPS